MAKTVTIVYIHSFRNHILELVTLQSFFFSCTQSLPLKLDRNTRMQISFDKEKNLNSFFFVFVFAL